MPDFRMQNNFPMADVINATQKKGQLDNQTALQQSELFNQAIGKIGEIGQSLYDSKKRIAQSLALGRQFDIPDDVAKTMTPDQILSVGTIKKGAVDMNTLINLLHPGAGGTSLAVPSSPTAQDSASVSAPAPQASKPAPAPIQPGASLPIDHSADLASASPTIPMPAPATTPPAMPFGGGSAAPAAAAPASMPVPIQAPPVMPKTVNKATLDAFYKMNPTAVVSQSQALSQGSVPHGAKVINTNNTTDNVRWDTATPQQQKLAQAYYEGRVRSADIGFKDKGKMTLLANEYASQAGLPAFKAFDADTNANMAKYATAGKLGQNALSLNTALGHAASAFDSYQAIGNTNQQWLNTPLNKLRTITNDPNVVALGINLNALQGEMANVFKNSGGTDQEIDRWQKYLNEDLTPSQVIGAMSKVDDLLKSRLNAMEFQRATAGGGNGQPLISPHAQGISERLSKVPATSGAPAWSDKAEQRLQELLAKQKAGTIK